MTTEQTTENAGPGKPRRGWRPGVFGQVIIFVAIWAVLAALFGLLAAVPAIVEGLRHGGEGSSLEGLSATSPTTLAVTAGTALATALAVWLMRRFFHGPRLLDLGLCPGPGWLLDTIVGLLLGPLMFGIILLVLVAAGWASVSPGTIDAAGLLLAFISFTLVAFSEEVLSRGWVLQVVEGGRGTRTAVIVSSALFALLHAFNPGFGLTALVGLFFAGLVLAYAYLATRQLWLPMAFHLSWNYSEGPLFGFPVSGLPAEGLLTVTVHGPETVTGGEVGPEAGLVVIIGIGLAALIIAGFARWRRQH